MALERTETTLNNLKQIREFSEQGFTVSEMILKTGFTREQVWRYRSILKDESRPKKIRIKKTIDDVYLSAPCGYNGSRCLTPCYQGHRHNCPIYHDPCPFVMTLYTETRTLPKRRNTLKTKFGRLADEA